MAVMDREREQCMGPVVDGYEARIKMQESAVLKAAQEREFRFLTMADMEWLPDISLAQTRKAVCEGDLVFNEPTQFRARQFSIYQWEGLRHKIEVHSDPLA